MAAVNAPLIVVVGETASGKTALGIELAKKFDGEIICADSRTVYRGMDIGTAKPTNEEQSIVPHHLLDIRDPDEIYTVVQFQKDAQEAIRGIANRGRLPIMVGGSGLYIDSVIYDYSFYSDVIRDKSNPRHLADGSGSQDKVLRENTLIIGIERDKSDLENRIKKRVDIMLEAGLVDEVRSLITKYGRDKPALSGICYQIFAEYLEARISLDEARQKFVHGDMVLAKKQRTWFKRNKSIHWVEASSGAISLVTKWLQTNNSE